MVDARRQQIENTASALFRERGYAATSVRDIARALDMQGASLYAHVASKEDVLWSIVLRAADRFDEAVTPLAEDVATPASVRLTGMIAAHIGVIAEDLGNAASFLWEWRFLSPKRRAEVAQRRDRYEACFRSVIEQAIAESEFDETIDSHLAATMMLSALNGVATWYRPTGALPPSQIANHYAWLLLGGLRRHPEIAYPEPSASERMLR